MSGWSGNSGKDQERRIMDEPIRSRPYSTEMACEKCCFGRGKHAPFCSVFAPKNVTVDILERVLASMNIAREE